MEHSFKRRRLSPRIAHSAKKHHLQRDEMVQNEVEGGPARPILKSRSYGSSTPPKFFADDVSRSPMRSAPRNGKLSALHPRNFVATKVAGSVQAPVKTVVSSVVQVVVNDGNGEEVTELLVPVKTKVISIPGFAPITLAKGPEATAASSPSSAGYQAPSPRPAASSKAAQTVQVQATRTSSNAPASNSAASSNSMLIGVTGSQSQAVLSSPPSTPVPSSPSSVASSTGSYFSSSSTIPLQSSATAQTQSGQSFPGGGGGNSTTSAVPSTTFSGSSTLNPAIFTTSVNSTLITSTRSSSSQTNGSPLTASASSTGLAISSFSSTFHSTSASQTHTFSSSAPLSSPSSSGTTTVVGGGVGGAGGTSGTGAAPSSTAASGSNSGSDNTPSTPAVVGGVVGGVAGLAIILLLLLFLLRRRRVKARQQTISAPIPQAQPPATGTGATTERSSVVPFASSPFFRRLRPGSGQTAATTDTAPSERGFQNMGGRKLESVLSSRGDGYSDPVPPSGVPPRNYAGTAAGLGLAGSAGAAAGASKGPGQGPSPGPSDDETLSGSSFYRDSHGFYGGSNEGQAGPSGSPSTSPPQGAGDLEQEVAVTRPGPARTPVINQPGFAPLRQPPGTGRGTPPPGTGRGTPPPPRSLTPQLRQQDDVGRSHPSFDGSRGSRFAEDI